MKLIYADNYEEIDKSTSDSLSGGKKGRNVRTQIWVINGVICDLKSVWTIYMMEMEVSKFALLFNINSHAKVVVKTPVGKTEEGSINNAIIQGYVLSPYSVANK